MNFCINKFTMLSKSLNKSFSEKFINGINIIIGEKDSGKTSLARAIMFSLGCDVNGFDLIEKVPDLIFILEFSISNQSYILIRKRLKNKGRGKNYFKLVFNEEQQTYFDTKSFAERLNDLFNINITTLNKKDEETILYPNHIFLPFFIDQDYSWQKYLSSTFTNMNFIHNYKKISLEYFTGVRSNNYYNLMLKKSNLRNEYKNYDFLINSKKLILEENIQNMKIVEDVDIEKFKEKYQVMLNLYENIIKSEHELKSNFNQITYQKNNLKQQQERLNISINTIIPAELETHCPNCNQIVYKDFEDNYNLLMSKENLIKEREKISMQLKDIELDFISTNKQIIDISSKGSQIEEKLNADENMVSLVERAESFAFSRINTKLSQEISQLEIKREEKNKELESVETSLNRLNSKDLSKQYNKLMIEAYNQMNIDFSYKNYYTNNLESIKIDLSGASKVQAYLAQYLSINKLSTLNRNSINIPMIIDTYLKDDLNQEEIQRTTNFVFEKMSVSHQSFLYISNNKDTLSQIESYDYTYNQINIESIKKLFTKDYDVYYSEYKKVLE